MNAFFQKIKDFFGGRDAHGKNAVRYLLIVVAFLLFLFFSNDFDSINVQKTAIVMAIGIDKEEENFSVTCQVALPSGSGTSQGESGAKTVDVVTQGKTVAQALDKVNEKTGWYPKLVFCRLLLLGESATQQNVFDALDFFLRNEYISDNCLVATCEGSAQALLSTKTPIDPSGSLAIEKVLSTHAAKVGACIPNTLRRFASSYFGETKSGYLPLVKTQPLGEQEKGGEGSTQKGQNGGQSGKESQDSSQSSEQGSGKSQGEAQEKVFSAGETALFTDGKKIGALNEEETFAYALIKNNLRLAAYSLPYGQETYTLSVKRSTPSLQLKIDKDSRLTVEVAMTVGVADVSKMPPLEETVDAGDFPKEILRETEKRLGEQINALFEKCRALDFDVFDAIDKLQKYENDHFDDKKETLLQELKVDIAVKVQSVR